MSKSFNTVGWPTATNNFATYGNFSAYFNGTVTVDPSGGVGVSGTVSGFDSYDFNPSRDRGKFGNFVTGVGLAGGAVTSIFDQMVNPNPATPYEIHLTPVNVNFGVVGR